MKSTTYSVFEESPISHFSYVPEILNSISVFFIKFSVREMLYPSYMYFKLLNWFVGSFGVYRLFKKAFHSTFILSCLKKRFDTRSGNILSFLLSLFQEGQLSVTGESMCTKYWLTA